jgi:hypothetical protein
MAAPLELTFCAPCRIAANDLRDASRCPKCRGPLSALEVPFIVVALALGRRGLDIVEQSEIKQLRRLAARRPS